MKSKVSSLTLNNKNAKFILNKIANQKQKLQQKVQNPKLTKIVQTVSAGHIRGGHSYH